MEGLFKGWRGFPTRRYDITKRRGWRGRARVMPRADCPHVNRSLQLFLRRFTSNDCITGFYCLTVNFCGVRLLRIFERRQHARHAVNSETFPPLNPKSLSPLCQSWDIRSPCISKIILSFAKRIPSLPRAQPT